MFIPQSRYSNADVAARAAIGPSTDILNNFVMARTMFDRTLDPEALIDEWLLGYHGSVGGPIVRQFMALIAGNVRPGFDGCFGSCETEHAKFLPPLAVLQAGQMFARGAKVLEGQTGPHAERLRSAAIQVLDVALLRWEELATFAAATDFVWPFDRSVLASIAPATN